MLLIIVFRRYITGVPDLKYMRETSYHHMALKNAVFWDVAPCRYFVNRRFGGTYCLHFQGIRNPQAMNHRRFLIH
jgi:hypothetical protein